MQIDVILDPGSSPQAVTELGLLAESYGLQAVWGSNYPSSRDPFVNLSPLALASSRIGLGPIVVTPYELHPYKTSRALASLNELCHGRARLLTGGPTGLNATMGADFSGMVGRTRECVEILKGASPEQSLDYDGKYFSVHGYQPEWAIDTPPLIYVGANKQQMVHMATAVADGLMLGDTTPERLPSSMQLINDNLAAHGRDRDDLRVSCLVAWHVQSDKATAISEAKRNLALRGMLDVWYLQSFLDEEECAIVDTNRSGFFTAYKNQSDVIEGVPDDIVDKLVENLSLCGDAGDVDRHIDRLKRYRDLGLDEIALKLHGAQEEAIRIIGERVLPALQ